MRDRLRIAMLLAALGAAVPAVAEMEPALEWDPFERPEGYRDVRRSGRGANRSAESFAPVLRATLVAGPESLVNLGGEILGVGEETHGYRLVEVRPFEAVFEKGGQSVVLEVLVSSQGAR